MVIPAATISIPASTLVGLIASGVVDPDQGTISFADIPQGFSSYFVDVQALSNSDGELLLTNPDMPSCSWTMLVNGDKELGALDTAMHLGSGPGGDPLHFQASLVVFQNWLMVTAQFVAGESQGTSGNSMNLVQSGGMGAGPSLLQEFTLSWSTGGFLADFPIV